MAPCNGGAVAAMPIVGLPGGRGPKLGAPDRPKDPSQDFLWVDARAKRVGLAFVCERSHRRFGRFSPWSGSWLMQPKN
jgi:hypothetical protein